MSEYHRKSQILPVRVHLEPECPRRTEPAAQSPPTYTALLLSLRELQGAPPQPHCRSTVVSLHPVHEVRAEASGRNQAINTECIRHGIPQ